MSDKKSDSGPSTKTNAASDKKAPERPTTQPSKPTDQNPTGKSPVDTADPNPTPQRTLK